jgi:uncharacterized protein (TIGR00288 family)
MAVFDSTNPNNATNSKNYEANIALFIDLENLALGAREAKLKMVNFNKVMERLVEKGKIVFKRAYCDFERYADYKRPLHSVGVELIEIPNRPVDGKNSADIRMVVDAMELDYSKEHIRIFVVASGDSDFSPLVSKLKENDRYVIGVGLKKSSSKLLVDNCDEFIYYEDIVRDTQSMPALTNLPKKKQDAFSHVVDAYNALMRENHEIIWSSMVKQTIKRKRPYFNEEFYGYSSFSKLLEDAQRNKILTLSRDQRSGSYIINSLGVQQA